ncbi:hypothetical protein ON010_g5593 [Phytophthora cinnamomi]|nr:hypothetical protein ON010_g5593 [Phytophthora cinnamomi]
MPSDLLEEYGYDQIERHAVFPDPGVAGQFIRDFAVNANKCVVIKTNNGDYKKWVCSAKGCKWFVAISRRRVKKQPRARENDLPRSSAITRQIPGIFRIPTCSMRNAVYILKWLTIPFILTLTEKYPGFHICPPSSPTARASSSALSMTPLLLPQPLNGTRHCYHAIDRQLVGANGEEKSARRKNQE